MPSVSQVIGALQSSPPQAPKLREAADYVITPQLSNLSYVVIISPRPTSKKADGQE